MRFYGQFSPPQDQLLYETYFQDQRNGFFMECGAFDGISESSCFFFEESMGWTGVNIEAVPFVYNKLVQNRPKSININAGLSSRSGIASFKHAIHPDHGAWFGNGSLEHSEAHSIDLNNQGCHFITFPIPLITFRDVIRDLEIDHLDLFVLDVEGHELDVIEGMKGSKVLPRVFCIEHGNIDNVALDSLMTNLGYKKDRIIHNNLVYLKD
jgi:FkbM family methyltransferase